MKIKIGIDIATINESKYFNVKSKYLTTSENTKLTTIKNVTEQYIYLAKVWAIKEAVIKAVNKQLVYKQINVFENNNNGPQVSINNYDSEVSVAYDSDKVFVVVILKKISLFKRILSLKSLRK